MKQNFDFTNLLVICNTFPNEKESFIGGIFIKDQLFSLSQYFKEIHVVIPAPLTITRLRKIPTTDYNIENIYVHFVKYLDFPPAYFIFQNFWIDRETNMVLSYIKNNKISFNIIHAHNTWRAGAVAIELKKIYNCPVVITEHTSNVLYAAVKKGDSQYKRIWDNCDAIIRVNSKDIQLFEEAGVARNKIFSIPNGFKKDLFYPLSTHSSKEKLGILENKKILLSVGALLPTKGYKYMLQALTELVKIRTDFHYYIIGEGKLRKKLETQVSESGLKPYVTFIGGKPHNEIPLWMNACDLFILPSINEGNPTVMFEALGCGKPFIGTKVGGIPEIITSEIYGLLVEPTEAEELAYVIENALNKNWEREKIIDYATCFTWDKIATDIVKIYEKCFKK